MSGNGVRRVCPPKNASLLGEMVLFSYHDSPGITLGVPGEFCLENDAKPLDFEGFSVNLQTKPVFHGPFLGLSQVTLAYTAYAAAGRAWAMILEACFSWFKGVRGDEMAILVGNFSGEHDDKLYKRDGANCPTWPPGSHLESNHQQRGWNQTTVQWIFHDFY